jgi:NAD(P)-dependent dehydrogenase (short-subunit alcohol dehydrogenase family)
MRVLVTGATGYIGTAVIDELIGAGHAVLGVARTEEGAKALAARGIAVHRGDLTEPETLAAGAAACDAVGDEGIPTRQIAEAIGRHLDLPVASLPAEKASEHFGFLGMFFGLDAPATAKLTRAELGWTPREPGLLAGLATDAYYQSDGRY